MTWQKLGAESAALENERLRRQGEAHRQQRANDALSEMVNILTSIDGRISRVESLLKDIIINI
jgi:hypothetical protein